MLGILSQTYGSDTFPANGFLLVNFVGGMKLRFEFIEDLGALLRDIVFLLRVYTEIVEGVADDSALFDFFYMSHFPTGCFQLRLGVIKTTDNIISTA